MSSTVAVVAIWGVLALVVTWMLVLGLIRLAPRIGLVDRPNQRSLHTVPKPRGGGIAFVLVSVASCTLLAMPGMTSRASGLDLPFLYYLIGAAFVAAISLRDDFRSLGAGLRFGCQGLSALLVILGVGGFQGLGLPFGAAIGLGGLGIGLTLFWILGLTNVYNFMDGIDGIAGTQGVVAGLGWVFAGVTAGSPAIAVVGAVLAGGCAGFLLLNWSPAKIFMGDVGSAFLGFSFAALPLLFIRAGRLDPAMLDRIPIFALLLVWPFVGDGLYTFFRRLLRGEKVWQPHRSHLYQRLVQSGWSHRRVSSLYGVWALCCAAVAGAWLLGRMGADLWVGLFPLSSLVAVLLLTRIREGSKPPRAGAMAAVAFLALGLASSRGTPEADVQVFAPGRPGLAVFVAANAAPVEAEAARDLARVLGKVLAEPFVVSAERDPAAPGIYVGHTLAAARAGIRLVPTGDLLRPGRGTVLPDAFAVETRVGQVMLVGATPEANWYAAAWLLQHDAGVRWYGPGEDGEVAPRRTALAVPPTHYRGSPAYASREIELGEADEDPDWVLWKRHNGLGGHLQFSHALAGIFTPSVLASHPSWAAAFTDHRSAGLAADAQPNLADPEVAAFAAESAVLAFTRDTNRPSFSLGINDTVRYDQGPGTQAIVSPVRYFRGMPDYSPLVFGFMNQVARDVGARTPGRYLGCLAYFWCQDAPSFPVDPRVVPYLAADRGQYYDSTFRAEDLALMHRWGQSGVAAFGLWEYGFGTGFLVPRQPNSALAGAIRAGWQDGARGYFLEAEPNPGFDAFKLWMVAQLLWHPERTSRDLADDFFGGYYGAAGKPMREFFDRCEQQWMAQTGAASWLKLYRQQDQAAIFSAQVCLDLRALLLRAERAADQPWASRHVRQAGDAFAVTEAYVAFEADRRRLNGADRLGESDLRHFLELRGAVRSTYARAAAGDQPAMAGTDIEPLLRDDPIPGLLWRQSAGAQASAARLLPPGTAWPSDWRLAASGAAEATTVSGERPLNANPDFALVSTEHLQPAYLFPHSGSLPASWEIRAMPTAAGRVGLAAGAANGALRIEGAWDTQCFQWMAAKPGMSYIATATLRGRSSEGGDGALFLRFLSSGGEATGAVRTQSMPKRQNGAWCQAVVAEQAPAAAAWVGVGVSAARQEAGDWLEVRRVEVRSLERMAPQ